MNKGAPRFHNLTLSNDYHSKGPKVVAGWDFDSSMMYIFPYHKAQKFLNDWPHVFSHETLHGVIDYMLDRDNLYNDRLNHEWVIQKLIGRHKDEKQAYRFRIKKRRVRKLLIPKKLLC